MEIFIKTPIIYYYILTNVTKTQVTKKTQAIKSSEEYKHKQLSSVVTGSASGIANLEMWLPIF